ncbi:MAG: hypothetical protein LQ352_003215 [Teloschistes flavicans]|nr:MAG: hypothetical protein LQ352_003215 [Teloschistes flavicans]
MNPTVRASSAPILGGAEADCTSASQHSEKHRSKHTPRSPGFLHHDSSKGWREFEDNRKRLNELKEVARTTPPNDTSPRPVLPRTSMTALSRTDSGRRRRLLDHISGSDSVPSKPLRRLLGLGRSVTTSDLSRDSIPRGSIEVAAKRSSGGRKYMKIAVNPKLYGSENVSTQKVNFKTSKAKGWLHSKPQQPRAKAESDTSDETGRILESSDDFAKRIMSDYPRLNENEPAKTDTSGVSNGYSPSKGIPKPELGPTFNMQDSAAATLAIAQAHACRPSVLRLPSEKETSTAQQPGSPIRNHEKQHVARWRASSKGPYSVPIKFQMRPQRTSLPKTPRTSLDESTALKNTSPIVNGKATAASPCSGSGSIAEGSQSEAESVEIMNAQSAEFFHGHGAFAYHKRKPPKPGPAPTRALPSLPEGHDGGTPQPVKTEKEGLGSPMSGTRLNTSPNSKMSKSSPFKGHRYRLSPVKNNVPKDACTPYEVKPAVKLSERFPQPPSSLVAASPSKASQVVSPHPNREVDVADVIAGRDMDQTRLKDDGMSRQSGVEPALTTMTSIPRPGIRSLSEPASGPDQHNLYIPWQQSRVERVKALKARDMEHCRSRQHSTTAQASKDGADYVSGNAQDMDEPALSPKSTHPPSLLPSPMRNPCDSKMPNNVVSSKKEGKPNVRSNTAMRISPIITIASQPPSASLPPISTSQQNLTTDESTNGNSRQANNLIPQPLSVANGVPHLQYPSHSTSSNNNLVLNRAPSPTCRPNSSRLSHSSLGTNRSQDAEARLAALEKRCQLLEKAFLAVVEASAASVMFPQGTGDEIEGAAVLGETEDRKGVERESGTLGTLGRVENLLRGS